MAGIADADSVDAFAAQFGADIGMLQASLPTGSTVTLSPVDFYNVYIAARDGTPSVGFARSVAGTAAVISRATGAASIGQSTPLATRFFDTFTNPLSNQWTYDPGVSLNAGRVSISTTGVTPGHYPVIETIQKYRLSGAGFAANMVQVLPRTGNYETQIETGPNYENHCGFYLFAYGFLGYITTNGVRAEFALPDYDPVAHKWWRVRESSGYIFFDTSPDGATWTARTSGPHSWSTESVYMIVKCGYWGATLPAQNILCDEVSLIETAAPPAGNAYNNSVNSDSPSFFLTTPGVESVSGRTVTSNGTVTTAALPNGDQGSRFDGTPSSYLSVDSTDQVQCAPLGALTVEAWVLRYTQDGGTWEDDSDGPKCNPLGVSQSGNNNWHWRTQREHMFNNTTLAPRRGRWSSYVFNPAGGLGSGSYIQNPAVTTYGVWFHMVSVFDDRQATRDGNGGWGRVTLYVNGVQRDSDNMGDYSIRPTLVNAPLRIGTTNSAHGFDGSIGKLAIYKTVLSAARIAAHYTAMTGQQP